MLYLILAVVLFVLSFVSGMLGLGVAFVATPVLGLFGFELKHVIMPWSLWLNGLTAISGAIAYSRAHMVDWRTAIPLLIITTFAAPVGVWLLQFVPTQAVWWVYVAVLLFLAYRMAFPPRMDDSRALAITDKTRVKAAIASAAIGIFAGFLGVGPGFLMMPTLVMLGYTARIAAATNAVIVTLPSFSAFASHLATAQFDWGMLLVTSLAAVIGAQAGAIFMSRRVKSLTLSRVFATALTLLAVQRIWILLAA
jgi:uncharacterized membrane protein YfcA